MVIDQLLGRKGIEIAIPNAYQQLLAEYGYSLSNIQPRMLAKGALHKVFLYTPSDPREAKKVIKIPINRKIGLFHSSAEEQQNIDLVTQYFSPYCVPAQTLSSSDGKTFCTVMNFVDGKAVAKDQFRPEASRRGRNTVHEQLQDIVARNKLLIEEQGLSLDLVGSDGLRDGLGGNIVGRRSVRLGNIYKDTATHKLCIVDYDLVPVRPLAGVPKIDVAKGLAVFLLNQAVLSRYFDVVL